MKVTNLPTKIPLVDFLKQVVLATIRRRMDRLFLRNIYVVTVRMQTSSTVLILQMIN